MNTYRAYAALGAVLALGACGTGADVPVRDGPQAVHPSPSALAQGTALTQVATPAMPQSVPTDAQAALDRYCLANARNFAAAERAFAADGFAPTAERLEGGDGSYSDIYARPGTGYAMALQRFGPAANQIFACGVIAPDSAALRNAFVTAAAARAGARDVTETFAALSPGSQIISAWEIPANADRVLYLAAISTSSRYGAGRTLALAVTQPVLP